MNNMNKPMDSISVWTVSDGKAGMENQCLGLAEALGATPRNARIVWRRPWSALVPYLPTILPWSLATGSDPLSPPWPDVIITSGRQAAAAGLAVRRASRRKTLAVHIQNPGVPFGWFDLVAIPAHDRKSGPNVVVTRGALHRVTLPRIAAAGQKLMPMVAALPRPWVAVLIGGDNGVYSLDPSTAAAIGGRLRALAQASGGSLLITPSRRTGAAAEAALRAAVTDVPHRYWDQTGENPYFAYLGLADHIAATVDSVSMLTEAASTGKPLHLIDLPGGSDKFRRFHQELIAAGIARPLGADLQSWSYEPLDDTARVATAVTALRTARQSAGASDLRQALVGDVS